MSGEEALVTELVRQAAGAVEGSQPLALASVEAGRRLLACDAAASARHVRVLVERLIEADRAERADRADRAAKARRGLINVMGAAWHDRWRVRSVLFEALKALLRRKLPLTAADLAHVAAWMTEGESSFEFFYPIKWFVKTVEAAGATTGMEPELAAAAAGLAERLRERAQNQAEHAYADRLDRLRTPAPTPTADVPAAAVVEDRAVPAGDDRILVQLKQFLGLLPGDAPGAPAEVVGIDGFPLRADSILRAEHDLVSELLPEVIERPSYGMTDLGASLPGRRIQHLDPAGRGRLVLALAERNVAQRINRPVAADDHRVWRAHHTLQALLRRQLAETFELDRDGLFDLLLLASAVANHNGLMEPARLDALLATAASFAQAAPLSSGERHVLHRLRVVLGREPPMDRLPERVAVIGRILNDGLRYWLVPGEPWADAVNADLARVPVADREAWSAVLALAAGATGSRPSRKWLDSAGKVLDRVGRPVLATALQRWLPLSAKDRSVWLLCEAWYDTTDVTGTLNVRNADCLRGLTWMAAMMPSPDMARALGQLATGAYRKIPGAGPRAVKVGNAAVYALGAMAGTDAIAQLAVLKVKVKFGTAQKEVDKALDQAAASSGLPREDIEELSVPDYDLEEVGARTLHLGDATVRVQVDGSRVNASWSAASGKPVKSVPASVRREHAEEWKELQSSLRDIAAMLPAQRDRLDGLFLANKRWSYETWRQRLLDHPLVGTIARRLLWTVDGVAALAHDGTARDIEGRALPARPTAEVMLWHPVGRPTDEVMAWRDRLEQMGVTQPFKQCHREVYVLTPAERATAVYSNRFAGHVLRQHQFHALCAARGWKNKLRLMVDDSAPPASRNVPAFGLRAEYWIEGAGEEYGTDTTESGAYLRVATDQVRFYVAEAPENLAHVGGGGYAPGGGQPVPLDQIPPLVLSEIMRDVDLFVGVASVGNDPAWQDGGPEGRYRDYWAAYSFGELAETARTRKQVLLRLIPKLNIAAQCSFEDRFLVVRGRWRTYKIHLGSGNILMEPNDQYLCIVEARGAAAAGQGERLFLPFEGDAKLSLVLSKAFLLAADDRIHDPTILAQIRPPANGASR